MQADRIDEERMQKFAQKLEEQAQRQQPTGARGEAESFERIGNATRVPGFNPMRWTTFICGRPTVVDPCPNETSHPQQSPLQ